MKNLYNIMLLFLIIALFQSCEKMIEIDLPSDQIYTENAFKDKRSALSALSNLYINLRESSLFSGNGQGIGTVLGLYTDELKSLSSTSTSENFLIYHNMLDPTRYTISSLWNTSYSHIYAINSFIKGVQESQGIDEKEKEQLINEVYILRTMYYQALAQIFGDIPYTESTDYKENTFIKKTPVLQVYQNIEKDLLSAENILSTTYRSPDKYYPNKAVAQLLLAKNYLLTKQYNKAEFYANEILNTPFYAIESNVSKVFKKTATSTIWQLSNSSNIAPTYEAGTYIIFVTQPSTALNPILFNTYDSNDQRKINWIATHDPTGNLFAYKYKNRLDNPDECSILFRIEEAYFILAEALIYQNREKQAIGYINTIRQRAGLTKLPDTLTKEQTTLAMLSESQKEFFLEHGRRFFDLKRNNKLSLLKTSKPNWQDKHALFPYPEKELLINPNLNPQNEY